MHTPTMRRYFVILSCLALVVQAARGQTTTEKQPPAQDDEVVRINTELVQTDVMVFDKKGRFVDGLKPEQFSLKIDGQPQPISFFERIRAGNNIEGERTRDNPSSSATPSPSSSTAESTSARRGRTMIFFIDDYHLSPSSLVHTRSSLIQFIEHGMGPYDQVVITSASGQIGFLQQFTDDKVVLRAAVARLNYRAVNKSDMDDPPMSEYTALKIREGDESAISFYVSEVMKQNSVRIRGELIQMVTPQAARNLVIQRAHEIVAEAAPATDNTLILFEGLMRTAGQLPGRKLAFFISDGFYLNDKKTGSLDKIKRITDSAGRSGVVIYTLDARGLIAQSLDVTNNTPLDSQGLLVVSSIGEISASQDGLNAMARDTGGRAFRNTNLPMDEWVDKVLDETAAYYLLAWRPNTEEQKSGKFKHMEVSIIGRPDLTVRLRNGYFKATPVPLVQSKKKPSKDPVKAHEDEMRLVIDSPLPQHEIPTDLSLSAVPIPPLGTRLTASIQINREALRFEPEDGKQAADIDIGGIFYDDKGKPVNSFVGRLKVYPRQTGSAPAEPNDAVYSFNAWVRPGLYQVRVGLRDGKSGRTGSVAKWIQVL
jgi:VWFA-related protein